MRIAYLAADSWNEWNCSEWRCAIPVRAWQRTPVPGVTAELFHIPALIAGDHTTGQGVEMADTIILERMLFGPMLQYVQRWLHAGKTVILDFDDAYHLLHPDNGAFRFWKEGYVRQPNGAMVRLQRLPLDEFRENMAAVSAVTTPSRMLCSDYSGRTRAMRYLPNLLEWKLYQDAWEAAAYRPERDYIVIGWGGSMSHYDSWRGSGIVQALRRVCRLRDDVRVSIRTADTRIEAELHAIRDRLILNTWVPFALWPAAVAEWDIALAPLHGEYDDRRSWIKPLEYSALGVPWIASDSPAYTDIKHLGVTVRNSATNWERAILDAIDNLGDLRERQAHVREWARGQSIDTALPGIASMYQELAG